MKKAAAYGGGCLLLLILAVGVLVVLSTTTVGLPGNRQINLLSVETPTPQPTPTPIPVTALVIEQLESQPFYAVQTWRLMRTYSNPGGDQRFPFGLRRDNLVLDAVAKFPMGVALNEMSEQDLQWDPATKVLTISLPAVQIQPGVPYLDTQETRIRDRDTGLLIRPDPELETQARRYAEQALLEEAQNSPDLYRATEALVKENLRAWLQSWMPDMEVRFR